MKKTIIYLTLSLVAAFVITACQNDKANSSAAAPNQVAPVTAPPAAPATANAGVEHYICPSGHVGYGSATQGTCSQCGIALVHNQAYHNNTAATPSAPATNPMFQNPPAGGTATPAAPAPPAEPAQNAAGVWHYTCAAGCAGGAGAAGVCSNCGGQLAHNQAYHN